MMLPQEKHDGGSGDSRHLLRKNISQDVDGVGLGFRGGSSSEEDLQQSDLWGGGSVRSPESTYTFSCFLIVVF